MTEREEVPNGHKNGDRGNGSSVASRASFLPIELGWQKLAKLEPTSPPSNGSSNGDEGGPFRSVSRDLDARTGRVLRRVTIERDGKIKIKNYPQIVRR